MSTDIVLAARRMLAAESSVTDLLGSDTRYDTWLFTDTLYAQVENSQTCAVVLTGEGSWSAPNDYNTARFPRLGVTIYADPQRDEQNNLTVDDTREKIMNVHAALFHLLHLVHGHAVLWDDVRVLRSSCLNEPQVRLWVDADHAASAQVFYAVGVG